MFSSWKLYSKILQGAIQAFGFPVVKQLHAKEEKSVVTQVPK